MNNHSASVSVNNTTKSFSLKWLGMCLGLIALTIAATTVFKLSVGTLLFGAILLTCPLLHIWMMKDGGHKH